MLKNKVAVVTGSTSGIGLGIARELARLRANLVLNGFGEPGEIESIRSGIEREHGVRVVYDGADMSKEHAVRGMIARTIETFGRLDILVNNAGIQFTAPIEEFPAAKWNAILDINLSAAFHGIAAAVPQMKKQRWGTDRQHRVDARPGRIDAQGGLCRSQARVGRSDQGGRSGDGGQRRHLQYSLSRVGTNALGRKADQRHRRSKAHKPEGGSRRDLG
ncbi:NAD(P)-dependent dehydrogenase (short-subunit alcohol dehydrogenase family) [Bradyrhizobium sp. USDA 4471]